MEWWACYFAYVNIQTFHISSFPFFTEAPHILKCFLCH
jgi:hypothetical protein